MNKRLIVPAILSAVMLSTPVLAGGTYGTTSSSGTQKAAAMTNAEKCTSLEKQFDEAIKSHEKSAKAADAKKLRVEAGTLCTSGKPDQGVVKLEKAMKDLGVKVKY